MIDKTVLNSSNKASRIRRRILHASYRTSARGSHLGASFSCTDILAAISSVWNINADISPSSARVTLSKGHACLALYSLLAEEGHISESEFNSIQENQSLLAGHPLMQRDKEIYFSTGSLGQGVANAVGQALFCKLKYGADSPQIVTVVGDGECSEGLFFEAMMLASKYKLDNLLTVIDNNGFQQTGSTEQISNPIRWSLFAQALGLSYAADINGNDAESLIEVFRCVQRSSDQPFLLIADTHKGYGVSFMQNTNDYHYASLTEDLYNQALSELDHDL